MSAHALSIRVPKSHPVQPLKPGQRCADKATCGVCGLSWDDGKVTEMTPAPSARCPFEAFHEDSEDTGVFSGGPMPERSWYVASTGNHQGLIIDEQTGRNVAVAYDKADAPLIASAPECFALLRRIAECEDYGELHMDEIGRAARAVISSVLCSPHYEGGDK